MRYDEPRLVWTSLPITHGGVANFCFYLLQLNSNQTADANSGLTLRLSTCLSLNILAPVVSAEHSVAAPELHSRRGASLRADAEASLDVDHRR
jgi:hypothetical protein